MTDALLSPGDPDPVIVLNPGGPSDFFLTGDHAGRAIPRKLGQLGVPDSEMDRHIAWDIGIAGVIERLSASLDATAVSQAYSRLVIDCNRDPSWPSAMPTVSARITANFRLTSISGHKRSRVWTPIPSRTRLATTMPTSVTATIIAIIASDSMMKALFAASERKMGLSGCGGLPFNSAMSRNDRPTRISDTLAKFPRTTASQN